MTSAPRPDSAAIPDFRLPASTGHTLTRDAFVGKVPLVVVFIPEPHSKSGTALLEEMDRRHKDFGSERAQLLAVVRDTARNVRDLADGKNLSVPILADASGSMARDFEADGRDDGVAVVGDRAGNIKRRFDPFFDDADPAPAVESLLYTVRATGSGALES